MGVYVRGMKMPDCCWNCPCFMEERDECFVTKEDIEGLDGLSKRLDTCPLIELPDHGDLIDRDKLKHGFCVECTLYPDNCLGENCDWGSIYHIEHAHAVIPAERSEE